MTRKPLSVYTPNAKRSQLAQATVVMPYKNASQIVIGDRGSYDRFAWRSVNSVYLPRHNLDEATTNSGILAQRVKWQHRRQV